MSETKTETKSEQRSGNAISYLQKLKSALEQRQQHLQELLDALEQIQIGSYKEFLTQYEKSLEWYKYSSPSFQCLDCAETNAYYWMKQFWHEKIFQSSEYQIGLSQISLQQHKTQAMILLVTGIIAQSKHDDQYVIAWCEINRFNYNASVMKLHKYITKRTLCDSYPYMPPLNVIESMKDKKQLACMLV